MTQKNEKNAAETGASTRVAAGASTGVAAGTSPGVATAADASDDIVLIGMPGAGKSTLGIVLAKIMQYDFLDADLLIQQQYDKTLQRIIDACGAMGFIEVENRVLLGIDCRHTIISTGGSAIYSDEAMRHLANLGTVVYLQIGFDELRLRLSDFSERGVVMKGGIGMSLRELYEERKPLYERYADIIVDVNDLSITAAARKTADALRQSLSV